MAPKKAAAAPPPVEEDIPPPEPIGEILDGDFIFQDGSTYTGEYLKVNDDICLHGVGSLITGPESFSGTFEKGLYKEGKFTACSGAVYDGAFRENQFHGRGEYTWPDGRAFKGMWKDGFMNGRGTFLNFSFGVDKLYQGFCIDGRYASNREEQDQMKQKFLADYRGSHVASAVAALKELAEKTPPDAPAPKVFFVPAPPAEGEEEKPEAVAEREAIIEEIVIGPFAEPVAVQQAAIQALVARLEPGAENSLEPIVLEERYQRGSYLGEARRLKREQLQIAGQCIELSVSDAEAGQIKRLVIVNTCQEYEVEKAKWKVIHVEMEG